MSDQATENTHRELWREREGDYYADSVFLTPSDGIGMNLAGSVYVRTPKQWVALIYEVERLQELLTAHQQEEWKLKGKLEKIAKHPDTPELIKQYAAGRLDPAPQGH